MKGERTLRDGGGQVGTTTPAAGPQL